MSRELLLSYRVTDEGPKRRVPEPVTPPVTDTLTLGIGAWADGSFSDLYQHAKTVLGTPHAGIYYPPSKPLTWDSRCQLIQDDAILAVTFKDWSQSAVAQFCADAAANHSGPVYVNWMNEAAIPSKNIDPDLYKQRIAFISSQARQYSNTYSFTELTEYDIRANREGPYLSGVDVDVFGWSIFAGKSNKIPPEEQVSNIVASTRQYGGSDMRFELFGWGATTDMWTVPGRAQWITDSANALRDAGCLHALWFNRDWPVGHYTLDDPEAIAAWTAQVEQNPS